MPIKRKNIILSILVLILVAITFALSYSYYSINKIKKTELPRTNEELGIQQPENIPQNEDKPEENKLNNILLMAIDKDENASDTLIILTVDEINKKLKMTSIMRDSRVELGEGKVNKINYAYTYGGPLLTIKTINENYKMDIMNYAKVDFIALQKIVDVIGGVDIDVKKEEIKYINDKISNIVLLTKERASFIKNPGMQRLNGQQAVAYCRIRLVGNQDFERTERQREVLNDLLMKLKDTAPTRFPALLAAVAPFTETSMDNSTILDLGIKIINFSGEGIDQTRLPIDGSWSHSISNGVYYLL